MFFFDFNVNWLFREYNLHHIIAILDNTGAVVVQYVYDAWGESLVLDAEGNEITSASHVGQLNPFRYRGYFYDVETGLYYFQSRYYDPEMGRFINMDNVDYSDPETLNGLNLYAYCLNNPVMYVDSSGHLPQWAKWLIGGGVVVLGIVEGTILIAVASDALDNWWEKIKEEWFN